MPSPRKKNRDFANIAHNIALKFGPECTAEMIRFVLPDGGAGYSAYSDPSDEHTLAELRRTFPGNTFEIQEVEEDADEEGEPGDAPPEGEDAPPPGVIQPPKTAKQARR